MIARLAAAPHRGRRDWAEAAAMGAGLAALSWGAGRAAGLLPPPSPSLDLETLGRAALAFFTPALLEEVAFRGPLLVARLRRVPVAAMLLALYVAWHPLGAVLRPDIAPTLADPVFLGLAAALGLACTVSVWRARAIVPAVAMHWGLVAGWIILFGGLRSAPS